MMDAHLALSLINYLPFWPGQRRVVSAILRAAVCPIGVDSLIGAPIYGDDLAGLRVGANVHIGRRLTVFGDAVVGDGCVLSESVTLAAVNHLGFAGGKRDTQMGLIVIEPNCWIGCNVILCPNVRIGQGSTIGAGSVVTHDVLPFSVAAGNPARVIRPCVRE